MRDKVSYSTLLPSFTRGQQYDDVWKMIPWYNLQAFVKWHIMLSGNVLEALGYSALYSPNLK